jgi:hypothetical protein
LTDRRILLILENCDALAANAPHTFNSLISLFIKECKISVILTSSIHIQVQEGLEVRKFALRHLNNNESYLLLSLYSKEFTSQKLSDQQERDDYNQAISQVLRECQGLPKRIKHWGEVLKGKTTKRILSMMQFMSSEDSADRIPEDLPDLVFKRSHTTSMDINKKAMPMLSLGRSSFEGFPSLRTTEH